MRITLEVPFAIGQVVYQAVYSYIGGNGEWNDIIIDWIVAGYKLDELGHFFCICSRIQGEVKRIEHLDPKHLFLSEESAREFLRGRKTIPHRPTDGAPFTQGSL